MIVQSLSMFVGWLLNAFYDCLLTMILYDSPTSLCLRGSNVFLWVLLFVKLFILFASAPCHQLHFVSFRVVSCSSINNRYCVRMTLLQIPARCTSVFPLSCTIVGPTVAVMFLFPHSSFLVKFARVFEFSCQLLQVLHHLRQCRYFIVASYCLACEVVVLRVHVLDSFFVFKSFVFDFIRHLWCDVLKALVGFLRWFVDILCIIFVVFVISCEVGFEGCPRFLIFREFSPISASC